ncbi:MAG: CBU_0585 family protein [Francisella endosymbiont of Hyalomma asiaticum]
MMKLILSLAHLFDNKKDRAYVSEVDRFLQKFDKENPQKSELQKKEISKHRNIFNREAKPKASFLDSE